jgi:hypothetical protein
MGNIIFGKGNSTIQITPPVSLIVQESITPDPIIITQIKEVIREVPVEVIKEVIKEVPVEVIREVQVIKEVEVIKEVIREVEKIKAVEVKVVDDKLTEALKTAIVQSEAIILVNKNYFKHIQDLAVIIKKNEDKLDLYSKIYIATVFCMFAYLLFK